MLVYLSALLALLATAFFSVDEFTNDVVRTFTLQNVQDVLSDPAYRHGDACGRSASPRP